mgnify:CR=1 FL=1
MIIRKKTNSVEADKCTSPIILLLSYQWVKPIELNQGKQEISLP